MENKAESENSERKKAKHWDGNELLPSGAHAELLNETKPKNGAWSRQASESKNERSASIFNSMVMGCHLPYNIISGTSMACPHATSAAAYVKSFNPDWSPTAIKSALMTTASAMNSNSNADAEFAYGAGQINPTAAVNPSLVYEAGETDYVSMLCGQGYITKSLQLVPDDNNSCTAANNGTVWDLNYPLFALYTKSGIEFSKGFKRTVTNVGDATSLYKATKVSPAEVKMSIEPSSFQFKSLMEQQSFTLKVEGVVQSSMVSASLLLTDGVHHVRSPIVVYTE